MPSLSKRSNSPFWVAAFDVTLPDGTVRRLKKSTKKRKRGEAMEEALRLESIARKEALGGDDIAAKAYGTLAEAAEAAAKGELSEARARELIAKLAEASTGEKLRFYTVRSWAEDWLASKAAIAKVATSRRYRSTVGAFLDFLGTKADARLEAVTKADVRSFRDAVRKGWRGRPRSAATTNFYAADVASMFRAAVREGLLLASPGSALERLPEEDSMQRETFTVAEVSALVETAGSTKWQDRLFSQRRDMSEAESRSKEWPGLILVGFYTGARLGDCASLTWANVDVDSGLLTFMPAKTSRKRKRLQLPIHPRLAAFLRGCLKNDFGVI